MNKGFLIRASIIFGIALSIVLVAIGCEIIFSRDEVVAPISDPDGTYLTLDNGVVITNQDVWEVMKNVEGIPYLEEYVDRLLLDSYIQAVTPEDVQAEIEYLTYLTRDADVIAEIKADAEADQKAQDDFENNVRLFGYDPTDLDSLTEFVTLGIAKRQFTIDSILAVDDSEAPYFLNDEMLQEYYEEQNRGTVCSIELRFASRSEATDTFYHFNLVSNYEDEDGNKGFGLYDPSLNLDSENNPIPIENVGVQNFDDTNTTLLSENEVFSYYIKMWNYINPWETPINEAETKLSFCTNYAELAVKDYAEMTEMRSPSDAYSRFAQYLFVTMDLSSPGLIPYNYTTTNSYGEFTILTYKLSHNMDGITAFDDLTENQLDDLKLEIAELLANDNAVNYFLKEQRIENDLTIFDPYFRLSMEYAAEMQDMAPEYILDDSGNKEFIASIDGKGITPDDLFNYMKDVVGVQYGLELAKINVLLQSDYYTEQFGTSHDYVNSDNENVVEIRDTQLANIKTAFTRGEFIAQYGFDPASLDWDEFIYLAFNVIRYEDVISDIFMINELRPYFTHDYVEYAPAVDHMQDQVDSYFSINASHILFYVDFDHDLSPDDFSDYLDSLSPAELDEFNVMISELETLILNELENDLQSFTNIVSDYKNADPYGDNQWAEFKQKGIFIQTQTIGELHQNNADNYDQDFIDEVVRLYGVYNTPEESTKTFIHSDRLITSDFGIHLVRATKGSSFNMPTAAFSYDDVEEEVGYYVDGVENDSVIPNQAQVEAWLQIKRDELAGLQSEVKLPDSVVDAIEYYFLPVYNVHMGSTGFGIHMSEFMIENNVEFSFDNTENVATLQMMLDTYYKLSFPELYDKDAE